MPRRSDSGFDIADGLTTTVQTSSKGLKRLLRRLVRQSPDWFVPSGESPPNPKRRGEMIQAAYLEWAQAMVTTTLLVIALLIIGWAIGALG